MLLKSTGRLWILVWTTSHLSESPSWEVVGPKFKSNQCPYYLWPSTGYLTLPPEPMFFCYATYFPSKWIPREAKGTGASCGRWEWQWHCKDGLREPAYFSMAPSFPPLQSPELPRSPTFRELTWQWQWDGCSFSWLFTEDSLDLYFLCFCHIESKVTVVAEASCQKTLQNSSKEWACAFDGGLGHLWCPQWFQGSVNISIWCLGPALCLSRKMGKMSREAEPSPEKPGQSCKGSQWKQSWWWKSPM